MSGNGVRSGVGMERNKEGMNNRCKVGVRESGSQIRIFLVEFSKIEEGGRVKRPAAGERRGERKSSRSR